MYFVREDVHVYMCSCVLLCIPEDLSFTTWVLETEPPPGLVVKAFTGRTISFSF